MNPIASIVFITVAVFLQATADQVTFYEDCSQVGKIQTLSVEGCSSNPCPLNRGGKVHLEVQFTSNINTNTLTADVFGIIGGVQIPWTDVQSDACKGTTCPLSSGSSYTYSVDLDILSAYPSIPLTVLYKLVASSGQDVACFKLPVILV